MATPPPSDAALLREIIALSGTPGFKTHVSAPDPARDERHGHRPAPQGYCRDTCYLWQTGGPMKNSWIVAAGCALLLTATASAKPQQQLFRTHISFARAFQFSEDSCERRVFDISVQEGDELPGSDGVDSTSFIARVFVRNTCEGTLINSGIVSEEIPPEDVAVSLAGGAASFTFTTEKTFDDGADPELVEVAFAVTWQGVGEIAEDKIATHDKLDEMLFNVVEFDSSRNATFSGTATIADVEYPFSGNDQLFESLVTIVEVLFP